ncbi:SET domain-containing protein [Gigaspora margarita]|uniref:SET domain-containing protein n=1 Tax=Gigaspora margarita TaxID=4874 RepID=A0A8H4A352_GIGMA|nr:SET domain-containing protein [Gigaspora margarita]
MSKKLSKRKPTGWPTEIEYLTNNIYEPVSLKPAPYCLPLPKGHPSHPFTSSPLPPVASDPAMPNSCVRIKSLKERKDHPAFPGYGLFATKEFKELCLIISYTGIVTTRTVGGEESSDYVLGFDSQLCIDGWKKGSEARFINDYRGIFSKPNAAFHEYIDSQSGQAKMGVWVMPGVGKIKKGDEIVVSYGKSFWRERGFLKE